MPGEAKAANGGPRPDPHREKAARVRDSLVVVLAVTTGAVNAVTFLRLGKVFSSVVTGNLALLGIAVGQHQVRPAVNGGLALAGYGVGVVVGAVITGTRPEWHPVWPRRTTVALAAEFLVLAAFSGEWLAVAGHPSGAPLLVLLTVAAVAMGMQSAAVRLLGPMSSTYLTSTMIEILQSLANRQRPPAWQRSVCVIIAFVSGGALGAAAATDSPSLVPAVILVPLAIATFAAARYPSFSTASVAPPRERGNHPTATATGTSPATETSQTTGTSQGKRVRQHEIERHGERQVHEPESDSEVEEA